MGIICNQVTEFSCDRCGKQKEFEGNKEESYEDTFGWRCLEIKNMLDEDEDEYGVLVLCEQCSEALGTFLGATVDSLEEGKCETCDCYGVCDMEHWVAGSGEYCNNWIERKKDEESEDDDG